MSTEDERANHIEMVCPACECGEAAIHIGKRHMLRCADCGTSFTTNASLKIGGKIVNPIDKISVKNETDEEWVTLAFRVPLDVKHNIKRSIQAFLEFNGAGLTYINKRGKRKPIKNLAAKWIEFAAVSMLNEIGAPLYEPSLNERPKIFIDEERVVQKSKAVDRYADGHIL